MIYMFIYLLCVSWFVMLTFIVDKLIESYDLNMGFFLSLFTDPHLRDTTHTFFPRSAMEEAYARPRNAVFVRVWDTLLSVLEHYRFYVHEASYWTPSLLCEAFATLLGTAEKHCFWLSTNIIYCPYVLLFCFL